MAKSFQDEIDELYIMCVLAEKMFSDVSVKLPALIDLRTDMQQKSSDFNSDGQTIALNDYQEKLKNIVSNALKEYINNLPNLPEKKERALIKLRIEVYADGGVDISPEGINKIAAFLNNVEQLISIPKDNSQRTIVKMEVSVASVKRASITTKDPEPFTYEDSQYVDGGKYYDNLQTLESFLKTAVNSLDQTNHDHLSENYRRATEASQDLAAEFTEWCEEAYAPIHVDFGRKIDEGLISKYKKSATLESFVANANEIIRKINVTLEAGGIVNGKNNFSFLIVNGLAKKPGFAEWFEDFRLRLVDKLIVEGLTLNDLKAPVELVLHSWTAESGKGRHRRSSSSVEPNSFGSTFNQSSPKNTKT